jgi:PII-like signaling protein
MLKSEDAKLLRIFIGESDKLGTIPFYEKILIEARKQGLAGGTVIRGIMGYGANSKIHRAKFLEISSDLPLIIEIVDREEKILKFVEIVKNWFEEANVGGLITLEKAEVILYQNKKL